MFPNHDGLGSDVYNLSLGMILVNAVIVLFIGVFVSSSILMFVLAKQVVAEGILGVDVGRVKPCAMVKLVSKRSRIDLAMFASQSIYCIVVVYLVFSKIFL